MSINQNIELKDIKIKIKTSFNGKVHLHELGSGHWLKMFHNAIR